MLMTRHSPLLIDGSTFCDFETIDRVGFFPLGRTRARSHEECSGREKTGFCQIEHLRLNPQNTVLSCEGHDDFEISGDLATRSNRGMMTGDEIAPLRRVVCMLKEAPEEYICQKCVLALTEV